MTIIRKRTVEQPLTINRALAASIGLNEAIVIQVLGELARGSAPDENGHRWITKSAEQWRTHFPFWSADTIARTLKSLERQGMVVSSRRSPDSFDRTLSYRVADEDSSHDADCGTLLT